jgi:hypothetical protein
VSVEGVSLIDLPLPGGAPDHRHWLLTQARLEQPLPQAPQLSWSDVRSVQTPEHTVPQVVSSGGRFRGTTGTRDVAGGCGAGSG